MVSSSKSALVMSTMFVIVKTSCKFTSGTASFLAGVEGSGLGSFTGLIVCEARELLELLGIWG